MGEVRLRGKIWWVRFYKAGKRHEESSGSTKKGAAERLLKLREGSVARGEPLPRRVTFDAGAQDLKTEYATNGRKSLAVLTRRIDKHLLPFFGGRRLAEIGTADIRQFIAHRQAQGIVAVRGPRAGQRVADVSNAEINRELSTLKRLFSLAVQHELLIRRPFVPALEERGVRTGFFEPAQVASVLAHLPPALRPVVEFSYITGWRLHAEVLPLEWRHVDLAAGEVRLDPEATKSRRGRSFPVTDDLRRILTARQAERDALTKAGHLCPFVFFRLVAQGRGGPKVPKRITALTKAWQAACRAAGCPGRIPHDLRRSAIRNMVRRGLSEHVAMALSGHETPSVFRRYDITSPGDLRTAARLLDGLTGTIQGHLAETAGEKFPRMRRKA